MESRKKGDRQIANTPDQEELEWFLGKAAINVFKLPL